MATAHPSTPAGKSPGPEKKAPAPPARPAKAKPSDKGERPIADVDRKVRGGDA